MKIKTILLQAVKGGTGKTLLSTNIAALLSKDFKVGIIDADIDSPNLSEVMGVKGVMDLDENRLMMPIEVNKNLKIFSMSLYQDYGSVAFTQSGGGNEAIIRDAIKYTNWGDLDYMIIDLPAGSSDELRSVLKRCENILGMVVVTLPNTITDMKRVIDLGGRFRLPIIGVVENMSTIKCPHCDKSIEMYSGEWESAVNKLCAEYNLRYFGDIPYITELHESDREDSFTLPDDQLEIIKEIVEAITNENHEEVHDGPERIQSDQATV